MAVRTSVLKRAPSCLCSAIIVPLVLNVGRRAPSEVEYAERVTRRSNGPGVGTKLGINLTKIKPVGESSGKLVIVTSGCSSCSLSAIHLSLVDRHIEQFVLLYPESESRPEGMKRAHLVPVSGATLGRLTAAFAPRGFLVDV